MRFLFYHFNGIYSKGKTTTCSEFQPDLPYKLPFVPTVDRVRNDYYNNREVSQRRELL